MKNLNHFLKANMKTCSFYFSSACFLAVCLQVLSERISVEKCLSYSQADFLKSKNCYLPNIGDVKDGSPATSKQLPHLALIGYIDDDHKELWPCMGSLISENYILTTAHCVVNPNIGTLSKVRLGDFTKNPNGVESQELDVDGTSVHPDFNIKLRLNDIALIKLKKSASFNDFVRPACLYSKTDNPSTKGLYSGRQADSSSANVLNLTILQVLAEIQSNSKCLEVYTRRNRKEFNDDGSQFCASLHRGADDNCRGESGSALVFESQRTCMFDIFGYVVFGMTCGKVEYPDVYVKVPYYLDWIEKIVWP